MKNKVSEFLSVMRAPCYPTGAEAVEITVEPDKISILSYSGPDRSISLNDGSSCRRIRKRNGK